MRKALVAIAALGAALLTAVVPATPGSAVVGGGSPDTTHPNVGVLLPSAASPVARWCGVTPISRYVVVTAGHCAVLRAMLLGDTEGDITFDPRFIDSLGDQASGWAYTGSYPVYHGTLVAHPLYALRGSGYDVAVLRLDEPLTGVAVEPLPADGLVDDLKAAGTLRKQPLSLVGYGTTQRLPGNVTVGGGYRQLSPQAVQSVGSTIMKHQGTDGGAACDYDSGSALFLRDQLVGVLSQADGACSSLGISARLDVPAVSSWLAEQVASAG